MKKFCIKFYTKPKEPVGIAGVRVGYRSNPNFRDKGIYFKQLTKMKTDNQITEESAPLIAEIMQISQAKACIIILLENKTDGVMLSAAKSEVEHESLDVLVDKIKEALGFDELPLRNYNLN